MASSSTEQRITCERHTPEKLLLRISRRGLLAWCDRCKKEVLVPWELVERLRRELVGLAGCVDEALSPDCDHAAGGEVRSTGAGHAETNVL